MCWTLLRPAIRRCRSCRGDWTSTSSLTWSAVAAIIIGTTVNSTAPATKIRRTSMPRTTFRTIGRRCHRCRHASSAAIPLPTPASIPGRYPSTARGCTGAVACWSPRRSSRRPGTAACRTASWGPTRPSSRRSTSTVIPTASSARSIPASAGLIPTTWSGDICTTRACVPSRATRSTPKLLRQSKSIPMPSTPSTRPLTRLLMKPRWGCRCSRPWAMAPSTSRAGAPIGRWRSTSLTSTRAPVSVPSPAATSSPTCSVPSSRDRMHAKGEFQDRWRRRSLLLCDCAQDITFGFNIYISGLLLLCL
mmetsp:Transcript_19850/g.57030  ORF Transcript_19850/g.57030 Transcript_19850/m.57030 type:complete len:305 (-) Transcript_19850:939-1853(-)